MVTIKNINGDKTITASKNMPKPLRLDPESHDASPDAQQKANSRELLLDRSSIIIASTKIERAASHIYGRVRQADGASVTDALKISYKHADYPNVVYMYKRKDIVYDIQRGWIYLIPAAASSSEGIEIASTAPNPDLIINRTMPRGPH